MGYFASFDTSTNVLGTNIILSNNNRTATFTGAGSNQGARSSDGVKTYGRFANGKYYMEWTGTNGGNDGLGLSQCTATYAGLISGDTSGPGAAAMLYPSGHFFVFTSMTTTGIGWTNLSTVGMALDMALQKLWYTNDGVNWTGGGDPASGTGGLAIPSLCAGEGLYPTWIGSSNGSTTTANFGQSPYVFTKPTGFGVWDISSDRGSAHIDIGSVGSGITTASTTPAVNIASNGGSRKAVVIVCTEKNGGAPAVSSVTGASLTFSLVGTPFTYTDGTRNGRFEVWDAPVSGAFAASAVTANLASAPDAVWLAGCVVSQFTSWDGSPTTGSAVTASPAVNVTTTGSDGILIGGVGTMRTSNTTGPGIDNNMSRLCILFENTAAVNDMWGNASARSFSNVLAASNFNFGTMTAMIWGEMVVALGGSFASFPPPEFDGAGRLTVNATIPNTGLPKFLANKGGTDQTGLASNVTTQVTAINEIYDIGNNYTAGSSTWIPPPGIVYLSAQCFMSGTITASINVSTISIMKNGTAIAFQTRRAYSNSEGNAVTILDQANGTDQYTFSIKPLTTSGTATAVGQIPPTGGMLAIFQGHFIMSVSVPTSIIFRKTLSSIGGRVGSRQLQNGIGG